MPFVIALTEPTFPTSDQLKRAFRAVKRFTDADAMKAANDACGILVKNLSIDDARALQQGLHAVGVGSEVVDFSQLPRLADPRFLRRMEFQEQALVIQDPLGRSVPVPWGGFNLISAGSVRHFGIAAERTEKTEVKFDAVRGMRVRTVSDVRHKVEAGMPFLIDLFVAGGAMRFQIEADSFQFKHCFDHPDWDIARKVGLLALMLTQHAPQAMVNRGATALLNNDFDNAAYPSKTALFEESIWLFWRAARCGASPG